MAALPKFYLPVILPPRKTPGKPLPYYSAISGLTAIAADSGGSDGSLKIGITDTSEVPPAPQFDHPFALSSVFAPTSGFARFYPGSVALPTPGQNPMVPPPGLTTTDIGSIVIRVWISDYMDFSRARSATSPRPNRIVLGWLQRSAVEIAFKAEIGKLPVKVLEKSWKNAGGTGPLPNLSVLQGAYLALFMAGDIEIFVSAGAPLGLAALTSPPLATLKLQTFFQPKDSSSPPIVVAADDIIDNAVSESSFEGHPLVQASNGPVTIKFKSKFTVWNDQTRSYQPLANKIVTLMTAPDSVTIDAMSTDSSGYFASDFTASLMKRDLIFFSYGTTGEKIGNHTFEKDIGTESHPARLYLNAAQENTHEYQASENIYAAYRTFIDELADNSDNEAFERDRGNGDTWDKSTSFTPKNYAFTFASQKGFLARIQDSEIRYKDEAIVPETRLTLLIEGDSWFSYPPDGRGVFVQYSGDIYGQLDGLLSTYLENKKAPVATYIRFPLQHHGDRTDQMFGGDDLDTTRQWYFTRQFLREYKIDCVICSAGGNDLAEPGISHWLLKDSENKPRIVQELVKCFTNDTFDRTGNGGYFDPTMMNILSADDRQQATLMMEKSFAILLNDHPWNKFARGQHSPAPAVSWAQLQGWNALGAQSQSPSDIAKKVILNIPEFKKFPDPNGDLSQKLLAIVYDADRYKARFQQVTDNWRKLLTAVRETQPGTPVFTHTYCYPLFSEAPTSVLSSWITGPWFAPRFKQAGITDYRIRFICMKAFLDNYVWCVLEVLKNDVEFHDMFDYVDVRAENSSAERWADEMHLHSDGYEVIATRLYNKIAGKLGYPPVPEVN